jgi:ATP-dependent Lon protease
MFFKHDVHIHVPEGAISKDGPSAGVTIAVAMISSLTGSPVRRNVAMTGEITLRGNLLPVGGIKEKTLAARRAKLDTMILPRLNAKDLEELPEYVKRDMRFKLVDHVDDVVKLALVEFPKKPTARAGSNGPTRNKVTSSSRNGRVVTP